MTAYAPTHRRTMKIPVEPAVYFTPPLAKVTAGNTYYFECPWENVKLVYADMTMTVTSATAALLVTIKKGSTTGMTITAPAVDTALGTQVDGVFVSSLVFAQGETITITTNASNSNGSAAVRLFFEKA
jgi:hypothetical protein